MFTLIKQPFRSRRQRSVVVCIVVIVFLLGNTTPRHVQGQTANEYQIKAAFILNFPKFIEWPGADQNGGLVVGIVGDDPFGGAIDQVIKRGETNARKVVVRRLRRSDNLRACHILFISWSEQKYLGQIIEGLRGTSVLTVGEMPQFTLEGGMIRLLIQNHKVRFEINSKVAAQAGLRVSSKLMALSTSGRN